MADYNLVCIYCAHGPHANGPCHELCGCKTFMRADVFAARALANINNMLAGELPKVVSNLVDIVDLLCLAYPDAYAQIVATRQAAIEAQKEKENDNPPAAEPSGDEGTVTTFPAATRVSDSAAETGSSDVDPAEAGSTEEDVSSRAE